MSMSKKHYEAIAARVRQTAIYAHRAADNRDGESGPDMIHELAQCLATDFAADNPNFDVGHFMEACTPTNREIYPEVYNVLPH